MRKKSSDKDKSLKAYLFLLFSLKSIKKQKKENQRRKFSLSEKTVTTIQIILKKICHSEIWAKFFR